MAGYTIACPLCPWERYGNTADVVGRAWDKHAREKHNWRRDQPQPQVEQLELEDQS